MSLLAYMEKRKEQRNFVEFLNNLVLELTLIEAEIDAKVKAEKKEQIAAAHGRSKVREEKKIVTDRQKEDDESESPARLAAEMSRYKKTLKTEKDPRRY